MWGLSSLLAARYFPTEMPLARLVAPVLSTPCSCFAFSFPLCFPAKPSRARPASSWRCRPRSAPSVPPAATPLGAEWDLTSGTPCPPGSAVWRHRWNQALEETMGSPATGWWRGRVRRRVRGGLGGLSQWRRQANMRSSKDKEWNFGRILKAQQQNQLVAFLRKMLLRSQACQWATVAYARKLQQLVDRLFCWFFRRHECSRPPQFKMALWIGFIWRLLKTHGHYGGSELYMEPQLPWRGRLTRAWQFISAKRPLWLLANIRHSYVGLALCPRTRLQPPMELAFLYCDPWKSAFCAHGI